MKRKFGLLWYSLLGLCLVVCASSAAILPKDKSYADYFLRMHAAELFRQQSFVLEKSWAYVSACRLERVEMRFSCYKVLSLNQARKLIVDITTDLVDKINADMTLKEKGIIKEPFSAKRVRIEIKTNNVMSRNADVASVRTILLNNGEITYETYTPSTLYHGTSRDYKETFEYALMLLDDPALIEQTDAEIRANWKKNEWKGSVYAPERSVFTKIEPAQPMTLFQEPFSVGRPTPEHEQASLGDTTFVQHDTTQRVPLESENAPSFQKPLFFSLVPTMSEAVFPTMGYTMPKGSSDQFRSINFFDPAPVTVVLSAVRVEEPLQKSVSLPYGTSSVENSNDIVRSGNDVLRKEPVSEQTFPCGAGGSSRNWLEAASWLGSEPSRMAVRSTDVHISNALCLEQDHHCREAIASDSPLLALPSNALCETDRSSIGYDTAQDAFFEAPQEPIVAPCQKQEEKAVPLEMTQNLAHVRKWVRMPEVPHGDLLSLSEATTER